MQPMEGLQAGRGPSEQPLFTPFFQLILNFCTMSTALCTLTCTLSSPANQPPGLSDQSPQNHSTELKKEAFLS